MFWTQEKYWEKTVQLHKAIKPQLKNIPELKSEQPNLDLVKLSDSIVAELRKGAKNSETYGVEESKFYVRPFMKCVAAPDRKQYLESIEFAFEEKQVDLSYKLFLIDAGDVYEARYRVRSPITNESIYTNCNVKHPVVYPKGIIPCQIPCQEPAKPPSPEETAHDPEHHN